MDTMTRTVIIFNIPLAVAGLISFVHGNIGEQAPLILIAAAICWTITLLREE